MFLLSLSFPTKTSAAPGQRGAILVFAAFTLIVLGALIVFAIDMARLSGGHTQVQATSDHVALAALEEYFSFDPVKQIPGFSGDDRAKHKAKFDSAVQVAEHVADLNTVTALYDSRLGGTGSLRVPGTTNPGPKGSIKPGRYWTEPPSGCSGGGIPGGGTCPCGVPLPCFQQCDDNNGCPILSASQDKPYAWAIRVTLHTDSGNRVQNLFGGILGRRESGIGAVATAGGYGSIAAALPKATVLLVDVSRNATIENYKPWERNDLSVNPREYAFPLDVNSCGNLTADRSTWTPKIMGPTLDLGGYPTNPSTLSWDSSPEVRKVWEKVLASGAGLQYSCFRAPNLGKYAINTVTPPEPFTTLQAAARTAIEEFQAQATAQDYISLVYYDRNAAMTNRGIHPLTLKSRTAEIDEMKRMTSTSNDPVELAYRIEKGIFPRFESYNDFKGRRSGNYSSVNDAMDKAYSVIRNQTNFLLTDNSIFLFTSGLPNCYKWPRYVGAPVCRGFLPTKAILAANGVPVSAAHYDELINDYYLASRRAMDTLVYVKAGAQLKKDKIRLYVYLRGQEVMPHTLLVPSLDTPNKCMKPDELEMRTRNYMNAKRWPMSDDLNPEDPTTALAVQKKRQYLELGMVPGAILNDLAPAAAVDPRPYLESPFYHYLAAAVSQGDWIPLRDPCFAWAGSANGDEICASGSNFIGMAPIQYLRDYPEELPDGNVYDNNIAGTVCPSPIPPGVNCPRDPLDSSDSELFNIIDTAGSMGAIMDAEGRVRCDLARRSIRNQVKDQVTDYLSKRPLILVK